jgi:predicted transcriptional regulator
MRSERPADTLEPPDFAAAIQATAEEEHRQPCEVVREAYERYVDEQEWRELLAYGRERARTLGLTEADVPRLIAEVRRERRGEGGTAAE